LFWDVPRTNDFFNTLLELIDALVGAKSNPIYRLSKDGREQTARTPRKAVRNGIGFISGDRANKGVLARLPILDNMLASSRVAENRKFVSSGEHGEGLGLVAALRIKGASLWSLPETLSGGTQQKMLIARWIRLNPSLLVLEEPTRGVDIGTKKEIYEQVRLMAEGGSSVVWWSTENFELVETCDVVIAFDPEGKINGVLRGEEIVEERIIQATGVAT
jgi:ribose transport system ATP-binding protein